MGRSVLLAGFPTEYGGANTEADHLIDLFLERGVKVSVVPLGKRVDANAQKAMIQRGCEVVPLGPTLLKYRVVLSFCNSQFLAKLPALAARGRPAKVIGFNSTTNLLPGEDRIHRSGLIDYFGFVGEYQKSRIQARLEAIRPVRTFPYRPYFNLNRVPFQYREWNGTYCVGRISRDDLLKFSRDTWHIYDRILVPPSLKKKVFILGFGQHAAARAGFPPRWIDATLWKPLRVPATTFYRSIDTMVYKTGGCRESYCRVLIEAYAHGVVPVVEHDYAFPELMIQGETGFMGKTSEEMSYYASFLAMNASEHRRIAENARDHVARLMSPEACWEGWKDILSD